jgi:dTDP-4-amino-4,6-dideoxygalactose transaminase
MFPVLVDAEKTGIGRDEVVDALRAHNIGTSVHYIPSHKFTAYERLLVAPLPNTDRIAERLFSLPLYPDMTDADVADTIDAVLSVCQTATGDRRETALGRS